MKAMRAHKFGGPEELSLKTLPSRRCRLDKSRFGCVRLE